MVVVMGHVDHGKTSLLDKIRQTSVQAREVGGITQHLGASFVPVETVKGICGNLLKKIGVELKIPGILMIDTPGHEAFTNLRKRGGSLADLAIVVVDINDGFMPQTGEAIKILKAFKVPFIIAANKIDLIDGWKPTKNTCFSDAKKEQSSYAVENLNEKVYSLMGTISEFGFDSALYSDVSDFTKTISIIPCSAKTGEGISDILMLLGGLAQKFLEKKLELNTDSPAKGSVLEVKEEQGLGVTVNVIIYDGMIKTGDTLIIAGVESPVVTKVRALLLPPPLKEIREKGKFQNVKEVIAAAGVKISAPELEKTVSGMPLRVVWNDSEIEKTKAELQQEIKDVLVHTETNGIILKADTLGSVEAIVSLLKKQNIPVRKAHIGAVTKKEVIEAISVKEKQDDLGVIMCFNVIVLDDAKELAEKNNIKVLSSNVIYEIIENYVKWKNESFERKKQEEYSLLSAPVKIRTLPGFVFRQSKPAVIGVEVLAGTLKSGIELMKESGTSSGKLVAIEDNGKKLESASIGERVAASIKGPVVGRTLKEGETLISDMTAVNFRELKKFRKNLSSEELEVMEEIAKIKRKQEPLWGY